jgi:hypothetical protein
MKLSQGICASILVDALDAPEVRHLHVDVEGSEIVVRKPGTLLLAYSRSADQRKLVLTRSWMRSTAPSPSEALRTEARRAAESKARELKWLA